MKLYATITSERASKGQGGNDLRIVVFGKDKLPVMNIIIDTDISGKVRTGITYNEKSCHRPLLADDEKCTICGDDIYGRVQVHHHNEECKKCGYMVIATQPHDCSRKGEKQKGEMREVVMYHCKKHGTYDKKCSDCILSNLPLI